MERTQILSALLGGLTFALVSVLLGVVFSGEPRVELAIGGGIAFAIVWLVASYLFNRSG